IERALDQWQRFESELLRRDGLLLGEALQKFAFNDPIVQAARPDLESYNRTKKQIAAFDAIFNRGSFLWPVKLAVYDLENLFRPPILHDQEVSWGPLPTESQAAFAHIAAGFASIFWAARTNRVNVLDMNNNPVPVTLWRRPDIAIDL